MLVTLEGNLKDSTSANINYLCTYMLYKKKTIRDIIKHNVTLLEALVVAVPWAARRPFATPADDSGAIECMSTAC